ncbi:unnamed protein product [Allacma fusca]|uniref:Uncharacterized protein n=1 Tax=Allacma fusca TaxID=39272 RepID=A0A8J2Q542_9HEXA|nr:unnamed protein product [Allacma fusca]
MEILSAFLLLFCGVTALNAEVVNLDCVDTVKDSRYSGWNGGLRAETAEDLPEEINRGRLEGLSGFIYLSGREGNLAEITKDVNINPGQPVVYLYLKYSMFNNGTGSFSGYVGPVTEPGGLTSLQTTQNYEWREDIFELSSKGISNGFRPTVPTVVAGGLLQAGDNLLIDKIAISYGNPTSIEEISAVCPGIFRVECFDDNLDTIFENGNYAATARDLPADIRDNVVGTGIYYVSEGKPSFQKILPLRQSSPAYVYVRFSTYIGTFGGLTPMGTPAVDNEGSPFIQNIHFFGKKPINYAWAEEVFQYNTKSLGNELYPLTLGGFERIDGGNYFLVDKVAIVYGTPTNASSVWDLCTA